MSQNILLEDGINLENTKIKSEDMPMTIGKMLSKARHDLGKMDIEEISQELCIRPHLLKALEQDDFNKFPSACYATGFLKNYAAYLGLNVNYIVSQYKKEFQGSTKKVDLVFLEVPKSHHHSQQLIVSMVIVSALVLYGVWYSFGKHNPMLMSSLPDISEVTSDILVSAYQGDKKEVQETVAAAKEDPKEKSDFFLVQQVNATPLDSQAKTTAVAAEQVRLTVNKDTWIRIVDGAKAILVDRILLAGEEFYLTDRSDLRLMTSNAGAVSLFVGNMAVASLGKNGEIRDDISLNKDDLLMKTAQLSP